MQSLQAWKQSFEIDWGYYIGDELPFLGCDFEFEAVSHIVATRATKRRKVSGLVVLDIPGSELAL